MRHIRLKCLISVSPFTFTCHISATQFAIIHGSNLIQWVYLSVLPNWDIQKDWHRDTLFTFDMLQETSEKIPPKNTHWHPFFIFWFLFISKMMHLRQILYGKSDLRQLTWGSLFNLFLQANVYNTQRIREFTHMFIIFFFLNFLGMNLKMKIYQVHEFNFNPD